jgi:hypothetical protein
MTIIRFILLQGGSALTNFWDVPWIQISTVGEALVSIGPGEWSTSNLMAPQMDALLSTVQKEINTQQADLTVLRRRMLPSSKGDGGAFLSKSCVL